MHEDVPPPPSVPAATTHSGQQRVLQEREQILEEEAEDGHLHVGFFCGGGGSSHILKTCVVGSWKALECPWMCGLSTYAPQLVGDQFRVCPAYGWDRLRHGRRPRRDKAPQTMDGWMDGFSLKHVIEMKWGASVRLKSCFASM